MIRTRVTFLLLVAFAWAAPASGESNSSCAEADSRIETKTVLVGPVLLSNGTTFPSDDYLPPFLQDAELEFGADNYFNLSSNFLDGKAHGEVVTMSDGKRSMSASFESANVSFTLRAASFEGVGTVVSGEATFSFSHPPGARVVASSQSQADSVASLKNALNNTGPTGPRLIADLDFTAQANELGTQLPQTNVIVFGNPRVGSPIWLRTGSAGVELPLEMAIITSPLGHVYIEYNTPSLLRHWFGITDLDTLFTNVDNALANFASAATNTSVEPAGLEFDIEAIRSLTEGIKIQSRDSSNPEDAIAADGRLGETVESDAALTAVYNIPHELSAINAGLDVGGLVNRVRVFGDWSQAISLVRSSFTSALDLPNRAGFWTQNGTTNRYFAGYTTPAYIASRHSITSDVVAEMTATVDRAIASAIDGEMDDASVGAATAEPLP